MHFPTGAIRVMKLMPYLGWLLYNRPAKELLKALIDLFPEGPSPEQNKNGFSLLIAEVENAQGDVARAKLRTPESYWFTAVTSIAIVERILGGDFKVGFQTPSMAYGADFVMEFDGVERDDL
jgi:short subunit dehydrogenase-like uncharacterized protein